MKNTFLFLLLILQINLLAQKPELVVPIGHTDNVISVAMSPDGQYVLTGGKGRAFNLWNREGQIIRRVAGHLGSINAIEFSPDGQKILTATSDATSKLWNLNGGLLQTFQDPDTFNKFPIFDLAFSPTGDTIITVGGTRVLLWNLQGKVIKVLEDNGMKNIKAVAFSPNGRYILVGSGSSPKLTDPEGNSFGPKRSMVRLWDLKEGGAPKRFFDHEAIVHNVAFSPDSKTFLSASEDKQVLVRDLAGKTLYQRTWEDWNRLFSACFSPNGKQVLLGGRGVELWDLASNELQSYSAHGSRPYVYAVAFSPDGRQLLAGCHHNIAHLWNLDGSLVQTFQGSSAPFSEARFSPDGRSILSGSSKPYLWDLEDRRVTVLQGHDTTITAVAYAADGETLLTSSEDHTARSWDLKGIPLTTFAGDTASITSVGIAQNGQSILTACIDGSATLWNRNGIKTQNTRLKNREYSKNYIRTVALSPNGQHFLVGDGAFHTVRLYDSTGKEIAKVPVKGDLYYASLAFSPDGMTFAVADPKGRVSVRNLKGKEVQHFSIPAPVTITTVTYAPDGQQIILGTWNGRIFLFDLEGGKTWKKRLSFKGHNEVVRSVDISPERKYLLSSSNDHTLKLWNKKGEKIATLFTLNDDDWVITTPSGLFDATPGAMEKMYFIQDLEFIELEQLKERYYEPGLLSKLMGEEEEIREITDLKEVALYPETHATIQQDQLNISLKVRNGGIGKVSVFLNNKEMIQDANTAQKTTLSIDLKQFAKYFLPGENKISLRAYNADGWLKSAEIVLPYTPASPLNKGSDSASSSSTPQLGSGKISLYAISIGTADYNGDQLDLTFSGKDASSMETAFKAAGGQLFRDRVYTYLLSTEAGAESPSKTNIQQAFREIATKAQPQDIVVVYLSGHGVTYGPAEKANFYYLTKDISSENISDTEIRNNYAISDEELTTWLTDIPALKQVMILDACNSGKVVENLLAGKKKLNSTQVRALDRMKDRTGMFVLAGSAGDKVSYEATQYGQGLLTYSLLSGMSGRATALDGRIDIMGLFQFSRDEVPNLAKSIKGIQTPMLAFPTDGSSFDIGIVNGSVKIPVSQVKPVFVRNNFQDEDAFDDVLNLSDKVSQHLTALTAKGASAKLVYVNVSAYDENSYSIKGRYTQSGNTVTVNARLFKGKTNLAPIQVTGDKNDLDGLVKMIMSEAYQHLGK